MEQYRQTLLGRALADVLGALASEIPDEIEKPLEPLPPMYTHQSMDLTAKVESFNRFMGKWSLQVQLTPDSLTLDQNLVDLHLPTTESSMEMLVKMEEAHSAVGRP
ncbi:TPA: hypothetical protein N0F65_001645 [Lagenidium giganteum]|uniref:Uncharacterized protein n=1 Tax=Lagenidium giganteum TaxID=4803 RepID=A0AAV2YZF9_9STRA|nr:TPA: hypothetical protein N0F65_001645 [Lagenidium giganteum]